MNRMFSRKYGLSSGILAGVLAATVLLTLGVWLGRTNSAGDFGRMLHASATDRGPNFVMATGPIDEHMEGVYFLDRTAGMLQCWVLSRNGGRYAGQFGYTNILADVGAERDKSPHLLMTTGVSHFTGGGAGGSRPANSVVYVLNDNNGQFAVYGVPWNPAFHQQSVVRPLVLINKGQTRQGNLFRDEAPGN